MNHTPIDVSAEASRDHVIPKYLLSKTVVNPKYLLSQILLAVVNPKYPVVIAGFTTEILASTALTTETLLIILWMSMIPNRFVPDRTGAANVKLIVIIDKRGTLGNRLMTNRSGPTPVIWTMDIRDKQTDKSSFPARQQLSLVVSHVYSYL